MYIYVGGAEASGARTWRTAGARTTAGTRRWNRNGPRQKRKQMKSEKGTLGPQAHKSSKLVF